MLLRRSAFTHVVELGGGRALILHAVTHVRLAIDEDVRRLVEAFRAPRDLPDDFAALSQLTGHDPPTLAGCLAALIERGFLTELTPEAEAREIAAGLRRTGARDPTEMLEKLRRERRDGAADYWASTTTRTARDLAAPRRRLEVALLADCDLQMEAEFLSREGRARALEIRVGATFPDDVRWVEDRPFDVVIIGALRSRGAIAEGRTEEYLAEARWLLMALRARTAAPILIDNLPEPTVLPLGLAERGLEGHRNRFRRANLALADLAERVPDVFVVDVAATLGLAGSEKLVDDGLTSFTHFGSPGWMLQRPESEKAAVHHLFPDPAPLVEWVAGDPHRREAIMARAHVDAIVGALGIGAKKCVILDLDGVLWPGVIAETGAPFAWSPEISGLSSHVGLYVGLHEALKTLKRRGIVLAGVSKNDEAVVRELWIYPENYPRARLLTPDDFVGWRVNWNDKATNIRELAAELGFSLDAFIFIDDNPRERERVRRELPEVEVWGEEPFSLRRRLLNDPRLQRPRVTAEAEGRTELTKARIERERQRASGADEATFLASLEIQCRIERPRPDADFDRVRELFERTTQFNTTGRKFTRGELGKSEVFVMHVRDRFADHGLVGAAVVSGGEIAGFAMSCRVIGLGVEHRLLRAIVDALEGEEIAARVIETPRNAPARNLYRDGGFRLGADGVWRFAPARVNVAA
jgi:FkbH-like protein